MRLTALLEDERAIEGLPVRLVIALVVGVASLSVMMSMVTGLNGLAVTELDTQPTPEVVEPGGQSVTVRVVTPEGEPVTGATVVASGGSARLNDTLTGRSNETGHVTFEMAPRLGPNQADGSVEFEVKPPAGSQYVDRRENTAVLVVEG